ncbi:MAG: cytochrome c [Gemmatimonadetes bacterium]|nr:cytochrome c [Gemmatimonadota bacterium]
MSVPRVSSFVPDIVSETRVAVTAGLAVVAAATLLCAPPAAYGQSGAAPAAAASTVAGVYTAAQASRGEVVYKAKCLECHVPTDYTGEAFTAKFVGGTVYDMFEQIRSSMPQDNPGSLSPQEYTDVVAFLFQLNALPTGDAELPLEKEAQKAIKVEAKPPLRASARTVRITHGTYHGSSRIR